MDDSYHRDMARVSLDLDPVVLARLRAAANRRKVTPDVIANELLAAGLRTATRGVTQKPRPGSVTYEYDDPEPEPDDEG